MSDLGRDVAEILTRRGLLMRGMVLVDGLGWRWVFEGYDPAVLRMGEHHAQAMTWRDADDDTVYDHGPEDCPADGHRIDLADPSAWMLAEVGERLIRAWRPGWALRFSTSCRNERTTSRSVCIISRDPWDVFEGPTPGEALGNAVRWLDARLTEEGR